jgi:hypothetical protein
MLFLGAFLLVAFNLNKAYPKEDFSWLIFLKKNLFASLLNVLVGVVLILAKDDLATIYPITKISIAVTGFAGGAVWQYLIGIFSKDKPTVVGL